MFDENSGNEKGKVLKPDKKKYKLLAWRVSTLIETTFSEKRIKMNISTETTL
jgi:hypothetical protein